MATLAQILGAEIVRVANGTHLAAWTDSAGNEIQSRIGEFLHH